MSEDNLFPFEVQKAIQERFGQKKAHHLLDVLSEIVSAKSQDYFGIHNARETKKELAGVLNQASAGKPQLIQRANDDLPLILMSMETVMAVLDHELSVPTSFWQEIENDLLPIDKPIKLKERHREGIKYLDGNLELVSD
ncbi:hypothetical protein [uncultured Xanthomonas sp.]|uniref:hypothetical protein n=1 Tax=uncultured Xanthomonas sp. TaxID=152831 RepID=UPI00374A64D0